MVYSSDALKNRLESETGTPIFQDPLNWPIPGDKPIFPSALPRLDAKRTAKQSRFTYGAAQFPPHAPAAPNA